MPPPDLTSYILTEALSTEIFNTQILPTEFPPNTTTIKHNDATPALTPLAVLIVGQTGAGKTRLAPVLLNAMARIRGSVPAHFIADTYKTYHPSFSTLAASPTPGLASAATGRDARRWLEMAAKEATLRQMDVLLESACRHPEDFISLARIFRAANYRVEAAVLAVPAGLSRLGILTRYYERLPEAGSRGLPVRLTPRRVHDDSYVGLADAARWIDDEGILDQVVVVRRGNLVALAVEREDIWPGGVADAVGRERTRVLDPDERDAALRALEKLEGNELAAEELVEVRTLLAPLVDGQSIGYPELTPLRFCGGGGEDGPGYGLRLGIPEK